MEGITQAVNTGTNDDSIKKYIQKAKAYGMPDSMIQSNLKTKYGVDMTKYAPVQRERTFTDTLTDLAPTAGSIIGGIGGTMVGGPVGGVIGAGAGGAIGETARQAITPEDDTDVMKIAEEGLWGAGSELAGIAAGKLIGKGIGYLGEKMMPAAAEKIATKNIGKTAVKAYSKATNGGNLAKDIISHEMVGRSAAEIADAADEVGDIYTSTIKASGKTLSPAPIVDELLGKAEKYLASGSPAVQDKGKAFLKIAETTADFFADKPVITPADLLQEKRLVAEVMATNAYTEGAKTAVETEHETILRNLLNKFVPEAKLLGQKQRDLMAMAKVVKGAEQLSAGGRSFPLVPILAAGGGGTVGGPIGAAAGYAAMTAANSPRVTQAVTNALVKNAPKVAEAGAKVGNIGGKSLMRGALTTLGGQALVRPVQALDKIIDPTSMGRTRAAETAATAPVESAAGNLDMTGTANLAPTMGEGTKTSTAPKILDLLGWDEQKFLKKVALHPESKQLQNVYERYLLEQKEAKEGTGVKKSQLEAKFINAANAGQKALDLLEGGRVASGLGQDILGGIGEKLGFNSATQQEYRSTLALARTLVRNALLGSNMTPRELESIKSFIPEYTDAPNIARTKLKTFVSLMGEFSSNMKNTVPDTTGSYDAATAP